MSARSVHLQTAALPWRPSPLTRPADPPSQAGSLGEVQDAASPIEGQTTGSTPLLSLRLPHNTDTLFQSQIPRACAYGSVQLGRFPPSPRHQGVLAPVRPTQAQDPGPDAGTRAPAPALAGSGSALEEKPASPAPRGAPEPAARTPAGLFSAQISWALGARTDGK